MDAAARILQFADYKGFGQSRKGKSMRQFFEDCRLVNGAIRTGRSVGTDYLLKINQAFPELNFDWVITGRGEMVMPGIQTDEQEPVKNTMTEFPDKIKTDSEFWDAMDLLMKKNLAQQKNIDDAKSGKKTG